MLDLWSKIIIIYNNLDCEIGGFNWKWRENDLSILNGEARPEVRKHLMSLHRSFEGQSWAYATEIKSTQLHAALLWLG